MMRSSTPGESVTLAGFANAATCDKPVTGDVAVADCEVSSLGGRNQD